MERHAGMALLELVAKQMDPGAPGFWRDFLLGMLKPVAATAVVAMAVALSFWQRLGLEGEMLYATARAFLQLSVIGFVLQFIFTQENALWSLLVYLFMVWYPPSPIHLLPASSTFVSSRSIRAEFNFQGRVRALSGMAVADWLQLQMPFL